MVFLSFLVIQKILRSLHWYLGFSMGIWSLGESGGRVKVEVPCLFRMEILLTKGGWDNHYPPKKKISQEFETFRKKKLPWMIPLCGRRFFKDLQVIIRQLTGLLEVVWYYFNWVLGSLKKNWQCHRNGPLPKILEER